VRAFLGLGANLGDRLSNLRAAVRLLSEMAELEIVASSRVFETEPLGPPQPRFLNAVVGARTALPPRGLLQAAQAVEKALGRVRGERWGPRVIDVDVLTLGGEVVDEPDLIVPHPRMHERGFVLVPLLELDPDPLLPGGRTIGSLRLESTGITDVRLYAPALVPTA